MYPAPPADGLLLVDKPSGPTSHAVVAHARLALGVKRIGHTGTLDPFASGLLLLVVGRCARLAEYLLRLDKRYRANVRLGVETSTHDRTGEVRQASEGWRQIAEADVRDALRSFIGRVSQRPPAYSAKRVGGRRAYGEARAGRSVRLDPVTVEIEGLELVAFRPPLLEIDAIVSSGTYIRALARDIGRVLGCGAHLAELRRTAIGPFGVDEALPASELEQASTGSPHWRTAAEAVDWLPRRELVQAEVSRVLQGQRVPLGVVQAGANGRDRWSGTGDSPVALLADGLLIAIAERRGDTLQPRKVLGTDTDAA